MTNNVLSNSTISTNLVSKKSLLKKKNKLGPYLLLQTLGEGEFGKVKLGVHIETGQEVAIKLIRKEGDGSDSRINKVEREISVLKILQHPYIVKLYNVVETEKYIGIILEYASGGELFEYILSHRFLNEKDAKRFFAQLISSVKYMHKRKIVHRDLKLENLLLDKNRNIIVTDFGFANQFNSAADDLMSTTCGSPCYAAPELVINSGLYGGSAVDIWSCGVILYAMLCGFLPFDDDPSNPDSDNINQLYQYIMSTNLMFPPHIGVDARDLLTKMLVPDPVKRCSLDYIITHPWLSEYHNYLKLDAARIEMEAANAKNSIRDKTILVNTSVSTTIPRKPTEAGAINSRTRKTHVHAVTRDRYAPIANDKYIKNISRPKNTVIRGIKENTDKTKPSSFMNFAITPSAVTTTTVENPVLVTPVLPSAGSSNIPGFVSSVKKQDVPSTLVSTNNSSFAVNPIIGNLERSLSSPLTIHENKAFPLPQYRGTDKFLSFFTGAKLSPSLLSIPKEKSINNTIESSTKTESNNDSQITNTLSLDSTIDSITEDLSVYSDGSSPRWLKSRQDLDEIIDDTVKTQVELSNEAITEINDAIHHSDLHDSGISQESELKSKSIPENYNNVPLSITTQDIQIEDCENDIYGGSIKSEHDTPSVRSSIISFKDTQINTPKMLYSKKDGVSPSLMRNHYNPQSQYDSRSSIKSSSTDGNYDSHTTGSSLNAPPQPEVSLSTRLAAKVVSNAVGESGRKAIAAVRNSISRKPKNQTQSQCQLNQLDTIIDEDVKISSKKGPLISVAKSRLEEIGTQINSGRNQKQTTNGRNAWGTTSMMASISELPGKTRDKTRMNNNPTVGPTAVPKKTGNKMMDWIKKKSQGKENNKKDSQVKSVKQSPLPKSPSPKPKISASKKTNKPKNDRELSTSTNIKNTIQVSTAKVISDNITTLEKKPNTKKSITSTPPTPNTVEPTTKVVPIVQQNDAVFATSNNKVVYKRSRAISGNGVALVELLAGNKTAQDEKIQIHQGSVDCNALTSQSPINIVKDIVRILSILGIETRFESEFVLKCIRERSKLLPPIELSNDENDEFLQENFIKETSSKYLSFEPIYGDASIDNGEEIRFVVEICRFKNLPNLYIVDVRHIKGNSWTYEFLYLKLIALLDFDKRSYMHIN